jgi:hypothetical protein
LSGKVDSMSMSMSIMVILMMPGRGESIQRFC